MQESVLMPRIAEPGSQAFDLASMTLLALLRPTDAVSCTRIGRALPLDLEQGAFLRRLAKLLQFLCEIGPGLRQRRVAHTFPPARAVNPSRPWRLPRHDSRS
jgi:hypothetical protein